MILSALTSNGQSQDVAKLQDRLEGKHGCNVNSACVGLEQNIDELYFKILKSEMIVGCMFRGTAVGALYANAELALALGITYGLEKRLIILQEDRRCFQCRRKAAEGSYRGNFSQA
jgi:hypothetical protein